MKTHRLELNKEYIEKVAEELVNELNIFLKKIDINIDLQYMIDSHIESINWKKVADYQIIKIIAIGDIFKDWESVRISTLNPEDIITIDTEKIWKMSYYKWLILQSIIDKSKKDYIINHRILSEGKYKDSWFEELKNIKLPK